MANTNLQILFEDKNLLAVNKPTGLVVNRSKTQKSQTLQEIIEQNYPDILHFEDSEFTSRAGLLHRLDKDTSGVILIAKNPITFSNIKSQFVNRTIKKEYVAVLNGKLKYENIKVDAPLKRNPKNRMRYAVMNDGKSAVTYFEKLNVVNIDDKYLTYVKIQPKTGRTHQIRVHSLALATPIVGDIFYNTKNNLAWEHQNGFDRLMLHAKSITLKYPFEPSQQLKIESDIPEIFSKYLPK